MVVESFYENVRLHDGHRELAPGEEEKSGLQFTPEPAQSMLVACLWSHWIDPKEPDVRRFAAITDEPPADVAAAGHDRCIVNLKPEHVEAWLTPEGRTPRSCKPFSLTVLSRCFSMRRRRDFEADAAGGSASAMHLSFGTRT